MPRRARKTLPHFRCQWKIPTCKMQGKMCLGFDTHRNAMQRKCNHKRAKISTIGTQRKEILHGEMEADDWKQKVNEEKHAMQANKQTRSKHFVNSRFYELCADFWCNVRVVWQSLNRSALYRYLHAAMVQSQHLAKLLKQLHILDFNDGC